MVLDQAARARLMRVYAPRLLAAGATPPDEVDETEDPNETPEQELVEELREMLPDVIVVENPDPDGEADPEPDDDEDDQGPNQSPKKAAKAREQAKAQGQFLTNPRDLPFGYVPVTTTGPQNGMTWTTSGVTWNPIVTTVGAHTFVTAPATTERASMWGQAPNPNPHILWMQGRFVGAERPNKNNAFWSTQDLELGHPTVAHGPLNWLHQDKHVIGTIADARFVPSRSGPGVEAAAETTDPHIVALSAIWKWVYPQEASVVQMASDAGVLAYSMECVSEAVQCVGDGGCGQSVPYMAYAQGQTCAHLKERATVRRLVNPTFLGGAVIVPPSRPGWADADATVMARAAQLAERAYEEAGRPDIPAATWEQLMAGVVTYTQST